MKNYKMIPRIALWVLMGLGIIISVLFYIGGTNGFQDVAGESVAVQRFTNLFLVWNYILVALVCLVTLGVVIKRFAELFRVDRKKAIRSLIVVVGFILLIVICWALGSADKVEIIGYEGSDNVGAMAKMSDACLYLTYILTIGTIAALVWGVIYTKTRK